MVVVHHGGITLITQYNLGAESDQFRDFPVLSLLLLCSRGKKPTSRTLRVVVVHHGGIIGIATTSKQDTTRFIFEE